MLAMFKITEPDVDTTIGSFVRKAYDVVAEIAAERDGDANLYTYAYDIDSKTGADLDEMVRLFGFTRIAAQRATGMLVFGRTSPSATVIQIPAGTQVATEEGIVCQTVVNGSLTAGDLSIAIPSTAVVAGSAGNAPAASLTIKKTAVTGISFVNNNVAFTGGTDEEGDDNLRRRFKDTVFRNMAGTEAMFLGIALNDPNVSQANVVGATRRYRERIELVSGTATSTVQDAAAIIAGSSTVGPDIASGSILGADVHYTFNAAVIPPTITSLDSTAMPDGIYDVEFEYQPDASRNVPSQGITNRVDVYVKGDRATQATETLIFKTSRVFTNTSSDPLYRNRFRRINDAIPVTGNFFVPYSLLPIDDASTTDSITINTVTYLENVHFWRVYDITSKGGAPRSVEGIEIRSSANGSPLVNPPNNARFPVTYVYNAVPRAIEQAIQNWRLVGSDVWVHTGKLVRLRLYMAIVLNYGFTLQQVQTDMEAALSNFIDSIGFRSSVQASDLLQVAHGVSGVDAVRFLTDSDDGVHYAIQRVASDGTIINTYSTGVTPKRAIDVFVGDSETPVLDQLVVDVRASNTFGSV
jgi:hypothetical protein